MVSGVRGNISADKTPNTVNARLCSLAIGAALLALFSCSRDPDQQKRQYLNSGEQYFNAGKFQEAEIQFRNAIQIDPGFAAAHYQLAHTYLRLRNPAAAFLELTETVNLDPKNHGAQLELATLLIARRQYDQAQASLQQVLKVEPANARAHAILAQKYAATRDFPNAVLEFNKASFF